MKDMQQAGLTLIELMVCIAIVGLLSTRAVYSHTVQQKKARRVESTLGLDALEKAQRAYHFEHKRYADNFDELVFQIEGQTRISSKVVKAPRYTYTITQPWGDQSFYVTAYGQIDGDPFPDLFILEAGRPD